MDNASSQEPEVRCARCGFQYAGTSENCPRCASRRREVLPTTTPFRSLPFARRLHYIIMGLLGVFIVCAGLLWLVQSVLRLLSHGAR